MPNWCINKIKITSTNKEELKRFKENVLDEGFDFDGNCLGNFENCEQLRNCETFGNFENF